MLNTETPATGKARRLQNLSPGGRKKGVRNLATIEKELRASHGVMAAQGGLMPLDVMLARTRKTTLPDGTYATDEQFQAAVAAAPYCHPRLTAVAMKVEPPQPTLNLDGFSPEELRLLLDLLRRAQRLPAGQVPQIEGMVSKDDEK